jgi:hypothetical protein
MVALPMTWRGASVALVPAFALIAYSHDAVFSRLAPATPAVVTAGRMAGAAAQPDGGPPAGGQLHGLDRRHAGDLDRQQPPADDVAPLWILLFTLLWLRHRPKPAECPVVALSILAAGILGQGGTARNAGTHWSGDFLAVASSLPSAGFIVLTAMVGLRMRLLVHLALS